MNTNRARASARTVGVMVCPVPGEPPIPEKQFFRRLSSVGEKLGLTVFVFSPHRIDWQRERVVGYAYSATAGRWQKKWFPLPDAVYDRCFYSTPQSFAAFRKPLLRLANTPGVRFLGYGLKGKWNVHQMLMRDERLRPHIPKTELLEGADDIERWLEEEGELFLKPHGGSHGRGVLHIAASPRGYVAIGRTYRNEQVRYSFRSLPKLLEWTAKFTAGRKYLIQRFLRLTADDGTAFDIRALVQKNGKGRWSLTGIAVRQGAPGSVTSNLHGGGHAEEAEPFLRKLYGKAAADILQTVRDIALRVPEVLETHHGRLAELGVDIGVDAEGRVWVLEANSKPGRSSFAALPDKQASRDAIVNPLLYAKYLLDTRGPYAAPPGSMKSTDAIHDASDAI
ncbi:YheC/YheD family endospore coat-associated protein [Paenibacillus sp. GYB003]|uniref:YheC/YheD family endospore coat-associated protein n=1 Tax=Paenibacillus sp. GYB003 TaxID=2994392 RepID=UPI002F96D1AC